MKVDLKKVLVTGADGFIGSHLTEALVRKGFEVRAFTFYNSLNSLGWLDNCPSDIKGQFEIIPGDIRDSYRVRKAVEDCDAILHLASLIAIPYSYVSPESYVTTNVNGTLNILQAAREFDVQRIVHTSTSEVYGTAQYVPIDEKHPLKGQSPYSATKIAADQLALSFFASYNLPVLIARPFNTYGPRQSARAVIPTIISQIAAKNNSIRLGAISPTRDFSYVDDTVSAFICALEANSGIGEVFNFGTGYEISIEDVFKIISELMGKNIELDSDQVRFRPEKSEVERLLADNSKAHEILNWKPKYAGKKGLLEGLKSTIDWFLNPSNLVKYKSFEYNI